MRPAAILFLAALLGGCSGAKKVDPVVGVWVSEGKEFTRGPGARAGRIKSSVLEEFRADGSYLAVLHILVPVESYRIERGAWVRSGRTITINHMSAEVVFKARTVTREKDPPPPNRIQEIVALDDDGCVFLEGGQERASVRLRGGYPADMDPTVWAR
jgi:hypothetical protein